MGAAAGTDVAARLHDAHRTFQFLLAAVVQPLQRFRHMAPHRGVGPHCLVGKSLRLAQLGGGERQAHVHAHRFLPDVEPHILRTVQPVQRPA